MGGTLPGGFTGETLSTGGKVAQGDLLGGAGLVEPDGTLSFVPLDEILAAFACRSALAPSLSTVGFGPTDVVGLGAAILEISRTAVGSDTGASCGSCWSSSGGGCGSLCWVRVTLVPSVHSMVSGAQSSSSSSISAHFASDPPPSSWIRDVIWMPYCCFNSSSVKRFGGTGCTAISRTNCQL